LCQQHEDWLAERKLLAPAARRNALLYNLIDRLKSDQITNPIIAVGITTAAPAIAKLLAQIARMPQGLVLLPHTDLLMPNAEWDALSIQQKQGDAKEGFRLQETHPQHHLKLLLNRMNVDRSEVDVFGKMKNERLVQAVQHLFCLPEKTVEWQGLALRQRALDHVRLIEADDIAEEARAVAVLIRQAIEVPERRVALVTPDREIALRVAAQLRRWDIEADDSAGVPLSEEPAGVLFLAMSKMLAQQWAPVPLLSVLKHPLVHAGDQRLEWLDMVRALDIVLRGPQMRTGLAAIGQTLRESRAEPRLQKWWDELATTLRQDAEGSLRDFKAHLDSLNAIADKLTRGAVWKGVAGRRLSDFVEEISAQNLDALSDIDAASYPELLASLLADISIRNAYGRHPRVAIFGLLEARLQTADLLICAGLNESSWPQLSPPDPWLAPHLRRKLEMPGPDRNIGLSAHDLANALGAPEVVLTRARRDRSGPTIASRFVLRLQAFLGERLKMEQDALHFARQLDASEQPELDYPRPAPQPALTQRMVAISITQMDMLKADPFAFYAYKILRVAPLQPVDADPDPAWKGTLVHKIIEDWSKGGKRDSESLIAFASSAFADRSAAPALRLLWQPRIIAGLRWVASKIASNAERGRQIVANEARAESEIDGIRVYGRIDRIDRHADGRLVIVDYKTGSPPAKGKVNAGYALQLGLAGHLVQTGGVGEAGGVVGGYEYWSLAKKDGSFGYVAEPFARSPKAGEPNAAIFASFADAQASAAINQWILGDAPFMAKLKPDYAVYRDYDQLMRLDEWIGKASWNEFGVDG
jgi:ATP-dependent helicase/nuclease subunit B